MVIRRRVRPGGSEGLDGASFRAPVACEVLVGESERYLSRGRRGETNRRWSPSASTGASDQREIGPKTATGWPVKDRRAGAGAPLLRRAASESAGLNQRYTASN